jgi:16S rRNA G966 N2-methylase RsmD
MNLQISQQFKDVMPPLTQEEYDGLEKSIISNGCRDPIVLWNNNEEFTLIDGHNRYQICSKHNIKFKLHYETFANAEEAKDWIITNQLNKRNLTDSLREYFRGKLYESRKKRERGGGDKKSIEYKNQKAQNDPFDFTNQYVKSEKAQNDPLLKEKDDYLSSETHDQFCVVNNHNLQVKKEAIPVKTKSTAEIIAKEQNVSPATVKRSYQYSQAIDTIGNTCGEEIKQKILKEEIRVTKEEIKSLASKQPEEQKKITEKIISGEAKNVKEAEKTVKEEEKQQKKQQIQEIKESIEQIESEKIEELKVTLNTWYKLGNHLLYCGDTGKEEFYNNIKAKNSFAFADPPYNAGCAEWDKDFIWSHDWLINNSQVVAVTPGIVSIQSFLKTTEMPYVWSMSCYIDNGMTRGAMGFGNWIYIALFSNGSIYKNSQDIVKATINNSESKENTHKGRKPTELITKLIELYSNELDTVIDPFLGSGTTLLIAEKLNRKCIGGEINPEFCKEIIGRWEKLTGKKAERILI